MQYNGTRFHKTFRTKSLKKLRLPIPKCEMKVRQYEGKYEGKTACLILKKISLEWRKLFMMVILLPATLLLF